MTIFPFTAVCGQEEVKTALLLAAIHPKIGGILLRGEKGTAKSTLVRGLAEVLPEVVQRKKCFFSIQEKQHRFCETCRLCSSATDFQENSTRVITLPLNATEDRIIGGLDFHKTMTTGKPSFLPGILAAANGHILYVDEVNLLDDHLVDAILAATANGINRIEREGISFWHPSEFVLIGTMNPEEGALRPQFQDRFGLCVDVAGIKEVADRVQLMEMREAFDQDPDLFIRSYAAKTIELREKLTHAQKSVNTLLFPSELRKVIADICVAANVSGHRADVVMEQAARAHAALHERSEVTLEDIRTVAPWVLNHRKREAMPPKEENQKSHHPPQTQENSDENSEPTSSNEIENAETKTSSEETKASEKSNAKTSPEEMPDKVFDIGEPFKVKRIQAAKDKKVRRGSGRRSRSRVSGRQGRYVKSALAKEGFTDIAFDATLRAAAPYQRQRPDGMLAIKLKKEDFRQKIRECRVGNFLLFVVDASGSMGAKGRMTATKGAILSLLLDAYQKRDKVAMISFHKEEADLLLAPTSSIEVAARMLAQLPVGGKTPLSHAMVKTAQVMKAHLLREPIAKPIIVLITDGKSNVAVDPSKNPMQETIALCEKLAKEERSEFIVVDTEGTNLIQFGRAQKIADALCATYFKTNELKAQSLLDVVKGAQA